MFEQLCAVLGRESRYFFPERRLSGRVEWGWRGGASGDRNADFFEEILLTGGGADAQDPCRLDTGVTELVRCVRRYVERLACGDRDGLTTECRLELAVEDDEGLLEVMPVWRRTPSDRDMHVDQAKASRGVLSGEKDGVSVADDAEMQQGCVVASRKCQLSMRIVRWKSGCVIGRARFACA